MIEIIDFSENAAQPEADNDSKQPRLIYVLKVGTTQDGLNVYRFLYSEDIDSVWMPQWNEKPACNCRFLEPEESMYSYVKEVKTDVEFILASQDCCHSYQDCCDSIIAAAGESIDGYEVYPEPFRLVFHFGDKMNEVDNALAERGIEPHFVR